MGLAKRRKICFGPALYGGGAVLDTLLGDRLDRAIEDERSKPSTASIIASSEQDARSCSRLCQPTSRCLE